MYEIFNLMEKEFGAVLCFWNNAIGKRMTLEEFSTTLTELYRDKFQWFKEHWPDIENVDMLPNGDFYSQIRKVLKKTSSKGTMIPL